MPDTHSTDEDSALLAFYHALGWPAVVSNERLWHSSGFRMYVPLPCRQGFSLSDEERRTLWNQGAIFLRYPCSAPVPAYPGYIHLMDDKSYSLEVLSSNYRHNTRRGLKRCDVERMPIKVVLREGLPLIPDTYERQGRPCNDDTVKEWEHYFKCAERNPLFEAWGAFVDGRLAAYKVNYVFRGGVYCDALFSQRDFLKYYVMNALIFVYTKEAIERDGITHVSYGMRNTVGDKDSLIKFKEAMGYRRLPTCERIEVNPKFKPFFKLGLARVAHLIAQRASGMYPRADYLAGILSTYLNQEPFTDRGRGGT